MTNFRQPRVYEHLIALTRLGPRPVGSPANQQAADAICQAFRATGLDVEEQPYACTAWEQDFILLEQDGERLDAAANAFSLPCDVTAPVTSAGTLAQLETVSARGKILLLYGDLARAPLAAKSWFLKDERDDHIIRLLEEMQPAALLAPPTATDYYGHLTEDWELNLPAATIPPAVARRLLQNPNAAAHLRIEARRIPATARNIVARTPGGGRQTTGHLRPFRYQNQHPRSQRQWRGRGSPAHAGRTLRESPGWHKTANQNRSRVCGLQQRRIPAHRRR